MKLRFRDVRAVPGMSSEEYHSKPYDSHSASRLKTLMESERLFYLEFKLGRRRSTEAAHFVFGQYLHHLVFESTPVTQENWGASTVAMFDDRNPPDTEPTVVKSDGAGLPIDEIWVVSSPVPGVFRRSRDWGILGHRNCHWRHEHDLVETSEEDIEELDDPEPLLCGFAAFQDMLVNGDGFVAIPYDLLGKNGSKSTKAFKEWKKYHHRDRVLDATGDHSWLQAIRMRQELRASEPARRLLFDCPEESLIEYTLIGFDIDFGYEVRIRMDRARVSNRVLHITDLKTSRDSEPKAWVRQCWNDHLPLQAWMMTQLGSAAFGMDVEYKYVAVGKGLDCRVEVFEMGSDSVELGGEMYDEAITRFQECDRSGIWRPKTHGQIHRVEPPYYMMKERHLKGGVRGTGAENFYD